MRITLGAAGLAACILAPHAVAQTDVDPRLANVPVLSATITATDTTVTSGRMRNRAASQMADFYPIDGTGFRLSAGLRFFESRSLLRQNLKSMRNLVYLPRSLGNSGIRWGYRRVPAMAVGYTRPINEDAFVGIEVGAMLGRAIATRRVGPRRPDRRRAGERLNPIVHLVAGVNF